MKKILYRLCQQKHVNKYGGSKINTSIKKNAIVYIVYFRSKVCCNNLTVIGVDKHM